MSFIDVGGRMIIALLIILALFGVFVKERRDWRTHRAIQEMANRR
jgi:hypothetical protein